MTELPAPGIVRSLRWPFLATLVLLVVAFVGVADTVLRPTVELEVNSDVAEITLTPGAGYTWSIPPAVLYSGTQSTIVSGRLSAYDGTVLRLKRVRNGKVTLEFKGAQSGPLASLSSNDSTSVPLMAGDSLTLEIPVGGSFIASFQGAITLGSPVHSQNGIDPPLLHSGKARFRYTALSASYSGDEATIGLGDQLSLPLAVGVLQATDDPGLLLVMRTESPSVEVLRPAARESVILLSSSFPDAVTRHPLYKLVTAVWLLFVHFVALYFLITRKR